MVEFRGTIAEDIRDAQPDWAPYKAATAPDGAPNVLYLLWDDTGIATWDCYGGLVEMPNMTRIADRGIRLTQFHTTALCSPTRAALLTGRNATTVGMASVENLSEGFPGHNGRIPAQTALISEVLAERGWSTYAVGKWHLAPLEECHAAGSRQHWPLGRGFDRFYGFLDGLTDQWYPSLVSDNRPIDPPAAPQQGYHLSKDLADNAIGFLRDHRAAAPDKPWFMYFCPGAGHSPHQVAKEWADKYRGRFDMGYERYREITLAKQKELGLVSQETELSPMNPYADATSAEGLPWPEHDTVLAWDSLSDDEKRVSCRMAEVFAGFISYTDAQIGRLFDYLEDTGQLDNTIVVIMSDNGASGEGGPAGAVHELAGFRHVASTAEALRLLDDLGGPATQMNYSNGWAMAFNTPYKLFKRYASHEGGIADPCIISWPDGLPAHGQLRDSYVHVSDVTPTIYDLLSIEPPQTVKGIAQQPLEGVSCVAGLHDATADTGKRTQFYAMLGTRGIWVDGWFAGAVHPPISLSLRGWSHFGQDRWELFHIDADRSQIHDLADQYPEKLAELKALWYDQAEKYHALPLNDLSLIELVARGAFAIGATAHQSVYFPHTPAMHTPLGGLIRGRSFTLRASVAVDSTAAQGVIFSQGSRSSGHALYVSDGRLHYACSFAAEHQQIAAESLIPLGNHTFGVNFRRTAGIEGTFDVIGDVELFVDNETIGALPAMRMAGLDIMQSVSAGRSVAYSVSPDYTSPFPFTGGAIKQVSIDVHGDGDDVAGQVVAAAFARD